MGTDDSVFANSEICTSFLVKILQREYFYMDYGNGYALECLMMERKSTGEIKSECFGQVK